MNLPIQMLDDDAPTRIGLLRRAVRLYCSDLVPKEINRANQRAWIRSVLMLGDKWLLAQPVERQEA